MAAIEAGHMTGDLISLCTLKEKHALSTEDFLKKIVELIDMDRVNEIN